MKGQFTKLFYHLTKPSPTLRPWVSGLAAAKKNFFWWHYERTPALLMMKGGGGDAAQKEGWNKKCPLLGIYPLR
ncbi:MAG: hypothetical protein RIQ89_1878 [Bacteroidota bacterium]|jgi:hypothetical protein